MSLGLNSKLKINTSEYDTNITADFRDFDFSFKVQYVREEQILKLNLLSFIEKFDLIKVTIPDERLQEIWNLVMDTQMMQDFLIEDIVHHYFIKSLPQIDLTNLTFININEKNFAFSILEVPKISHSKDMKYLDVSLGMERVVKTEGFTFGNMSPLLMSPQFRDQFKAAHSKVLRDKQLADDTSANLQMIASASLLSLVGAEMLGAIDVDLSSVGAVRSALTLKNLRLVFPSLSKFYDNNDDIVNLNLSLKVDCSFYDRNNLQMETAQRRFS